MLSDTTLASVAGLDLEAVDEVADVVEATTGAGSDAASGNGDGELVLDRAGLLLADLGVEQIADNALRFVLAFDSGRHDLVEGGLHAVELELAHEVEQLSTFHQMVLLRLS